MATDEKVKEVLQLLQGSVKDPDVERLRDLVVEANSTEIGRKYPFGLFLAFLDRGGSMLMEEDDIKTLFCEIMPIALGKQKAKEVQESYTKFLSKKIPNPDGSKTYTSRENILLGSTPTEEIYKLCNNHPDRPLTLLSTPSEGFVQVRDFVENIRSELGWFEIIYDLYKIPLTLEPLDKNGNAIATPKLYVAKLDESVRNRYQSQLKAIQENLDEQVREVRWG